jgi:hypothetical protein
LIRGLELRSGLIESRADDHDAQPVGGDELPLRLSARRWASIRTHHSRSTLPFRRQSLSFAFGVEQRAFGTIVMATPKGMRSAQFPVNGRDAVHVYSDDQHIWLQLRRDVPTEADIGRPSFKTAICLTPGTAHKLGLELLNVAEKNKEKQKRTTASKSAAAKLEGQK